MSNLARTLTSDIGLAIRDFCEGKEISRFDLSGGDDAVELEAADRIIHIDVSDPHNPVAHMASGAQFTIRIVRTG
jgi:hypothetical protein